MCLSVAKELRLLMVTKFTLHEAAGIILNNRVEYDESYSWLLTECSPRKNCILFGYKTCLFKFDLMDGCLIFEGDEPGSTMQLYLDSDPQIHQQYLDRFIPYLTWLPWLRDL